MNILRIVIFLIICTFLVCEKAITQESTVRWIESRDQSFWLERMIRFSNLQEDPNHKPNKICIYSNKKEQQIDGFGGCFNELGYEALQLVSPEKQKSVLAALFDSKSGCGFTVCRMPIGANDYAMDWYSHNETNKDFLMENFSIQRDKKRLIPYIKSALKINPSVSIWASPWCPPSWMKTNQHYACRADSVNDLEPEGEGKEMTTQFIMEDNYLSAYALYFSKFITSYQEQDIPIAAVHVQNEPNSCQNFPSCIWTPKDLAIFIGDYLGPQFSKDAIDAEIWLGTIERPHVERIDSIVLHPAAKKYIKGVGFQWAGKGAIPEINKKYNHLRLMQTETECGDGSNDWKALEHTFDLMKHYLNNGANSYLYWNLILNESGKSKWGWKQNSMITIDSKTKKVRYNPEYYLMKHFSYFIEKGSYKLASSDTSCLAFKNKNEIVIIYYNDGNEAVKNFILDSKHSFTVNVSEKSLNTFILSPKKE